MRGALHPVLSSSWPGCCIAGCRTSTSTSPAASARHAARAPAGKPINLSLPAHLLPDCPSCNGLPRGLLSCYTVLAASQPLIMLRLAAHDRYHHRHAWTAFLTPHHVSGVQAVRHHDAHAQGRCPARGDRHVRRYPALPVQELN